MCHALEINAFGVFSYTYVRNTDTVPLARMRCATPTTDPGGGINAKPRQCRRNDLDTPP